MKVLLFVGFVLATQNSFADYSNKLVVTIDKPKSTYNSLPSYNGLKQTLKECVLFIEEGKKDLAKQYKVFEVINSFCSYADGTDGAQKGWRPRIEFFFEK